VRLSGPRLLSTRLALISAAGVALAVAAFAVAGFWLIKDGAYGTLDRSLRETAGLESASTDIGERDFSAPPTTSGRGGPEPRATVPIGPAATLIQRVEDGRPVGDAKVAGTSSTARALDARPVGGPRTETIRGERFRVLVVEAPSSPDGLPRHIIVARSVEDVQATLDQAATRLGIGAVAAAILALLVAGFAARRGLRPLVRVRAAAERVAASEDLSVRIDVERLDEVGGLAAAMNHMLTRLEGSNARLSGALDEQRRFAADASHELRTPLTALRGDIELLRRRELPESERVEVLDEMAVAAQRMGRTVEDLLILARAEGGPRAPRDVDVPALLTTLATRDEAASLPTGGRLVVSADPEAMTALFRNLIDNARRHGDHVEVAAHADNGQVVVEVVDDGPGVAPDDRERVFDRFYRAPNLRNTPGTGLGLAIARVAAEEAGGSIRLLDSERGARFEVRLPIAR
jgi:signal transduction histidine kinase